jgi:hypothetical protein
MEEIQMRKIVLSALLALGVGFAATNGASAAPAAAGIADAAAANSLVQKSYVVIYRGRRRCHTRRICYINRWGHRHCYYKTYCHR